jgi:hypothetical protein
MHEVIRSKQTPTEKKELEAGGQEQTPAATTTTTTGEPTATENTDMGSSEPKQRLSNKRSIDDFSASSGPPPSKRALNSLSPIGAQPITNAPLPIDIPVFEKVTLYEFSIIKSHETGPKSYLNSETTNETVTEVFLHKDNAVAAFRDAFNGYDREKRDDQDGEDDFNYDENGLPYTDTDRE